MPDSPKPHPAIKEIPPEQWEEMIGKLMGFTYQYFKACIDGDIRKVRTPDGSTFEDIAQEIVLRVLKGSRQWDPDKHGDLLPYMAGQVKSLFYHDFNSWSARNIESREEEEETIKEVKPVFVEAMTFPNPESALISKEMHVEKDKLLDIVLEAVQQSGDDELWELVEVYLDDSGEYKPRHLAARLITSPSDVHNRQKRLIRCVRRYLEENSSEQSGIKGD